MSWDQNEVRLARPKTAGTSDCVEETPRPIAVETLCSGGGTESRPPTQATSPAFWLRQCTWNSRPAINLSNIGWLDDLALAMVLVDRAHCARDTASCEFSSSSERMVGDMGIDFGRASLLMAQQLSDEVKSCAIPHCKARKRVAQIVNPQIGKMGCFLDGTTVFPECLHREGTCFLFHDVPVFG